MRQTYVIAGMHCASCAAHVEKAVRAVPGVRSATVNFATEKLTVTGAGLPDSLIIRAVKKAGYTARRPPTQALPARRRGIPARLVVATACTVPLLYVAMGSMWRWPLPAIIHPDHHPLTHAWLQLALCAPALAAGYRFYRNGGKALWRRAPTMDSLVALGTATAFVSGLTSLITTSGGQAPASHSLYFESAATISTLVMLGKYLEERTRRRMSDAVKKLIRLTPKTARRIHNHTEIEIPAEQICVNDMLAVKPGEQIPADGLLLEGVTTIDESSVTGESMPVTKQAGDRLIGATINRTGYILMRATRVGRDTMLAQIVRLVETAQDSKAPVARLADRIAGWFVPAVLCVAAAAGMAWWAGGAEWTFAVDVAVAVLIIACPCALGLATPAAIITGVGRGAKWGVLIKGGDVLERLAAVSAVFFDKTGTLTQGEPVLTDIQCIGRRTPDEALALAAAAEQRSAHPLAKAIVEGALSRGLTLPDVERFTATPGKGVTATAGGHTAHVGSWSYLVQATAAPATVPEAAATAFAQLTGAGKTVCWVAIDRHPEALIAVADTVRPESAATIRQLQAQQIAVRMLTGDHSQTAAAVARELGITSVAAGLQPDEKAAEVSAARLTAVVAMVGDGINDAPALAAADVGIAPAAGADIAMEAADVVLVNARLSDLLVAMALSRAVLRNIRQNLFWAFFYNVISIPVAAGLLHLFGGPTLNPMLAALAMSFSSVTVVLNALRLKRWRMK
jgi:Cu+-exporting ATPase